MEPMNGLAHAAFFAMPSDGGNATMVFVIQIVVILAIFYFLLIRPQRKEQQRHKAMIESLKKGNEIVTSGGIIGTVLHVEKTRITIRTGESTRLVVQRARVAQRLEEGEED